MEASIGAGGGGPDELLPQHAVRQTMTPAAITLAIRMLTSPAQRWKSILNALPPAAAYSKAGCSPN
jgi:hypothetical protein